MLSLEELANFLSTTSYVFFKCAYEVLQLSHIVGQTLVEYLILLASWIGQGLYLLKSGIQVLLEDYLIFIQDVSEGVNVASEAVQWIFSAIIHTCGTMLGATKVITVGILDGVASSGDLTVSIASTIVLTTIELFKWLKNWFILLGSSIWLCVTLIPMFILYMINTIQELIYDLKELFLNWHIKATQCTKDVVNFFLDIPIHAVVGICLGSVMVLLLCANYSKVVDTTRQLLICVYNGILTFCNSLWTGRFLQTTTVPLQPKATATVHQDVIFAVATPGDKLCVVCQDEQRQIINLPCKHLCLCVECSVKVNRTQRSCPICRAYIRRTMKVYI